MIDGPIGTAAGNSAGIDLTPHMLETDHGRDLALTVAKILVVDKQRSGGQSQHSAASRAVNAGTKRAIRSA